MGKMKIQFNKPKDLTFFDECLHCFKMAQQMLLDKLLAYFQLHILAKGKLG